MPHVAPIASEMRSMALFGTIALAALSGACASTGAVPHPFPIPGKTLSPSPTGSEPATTGSRRPDAMYALTSTALALRGSPYRNGGADPAGFDCSGFTQYVFGQHGLGLPREVRDQFRLGSAIKPEDVAPGDLVFFRTLAPGGASHVGIALGGDAFIHAPSASGAVRVEHLSAPYWSSRFVGARRLI